MVFLLRVIKLCLFSLNIVCLCFGVFVIVTNVVGLVRSLPSTDEHTFFIEGIILSSFVCMATLIGCHGIVCEHMGEMFVYSLFVLILLVLQCAQMNSYPAQGFYANAVERLEHAWRFLDTKPNLMSTVESTYFCCGLYDSSDYNYKGLKIPKSCYTQNDEQIPKNLQSGGCLKALDYFYQTAVYRQRLYNLALFFTECIAFICSVFLSGLLFIINRSWNLPFHREVHRRPLVRHGLNHINSRTNLLEN